MATFNQDVKHSPVTMDPAATEIPAGSEEWLDLSGDGGVLKKVRVLQLAQHRSSFRLRGFVRTEPPPQFGDDTINECTPPGHLVCGYTAAVQPNAVMPVVVCRQDGLTLHRQRALSMLAPLDCGVRFSRRRSVARNIRYSPPENLTSTKHLVIANDGMGALAGWRALLEISLFFEWVPRRPRRYHTRYLTRYSDQVHFIMPVVRHVRCSMSKLQ